MRGLGAGAAVTAPDDTIGYGDRYAVHPLAPALAPALAPVAPVAPSTPATLATPAPVALARLVSLTVAAATANLRVAPNGAAPFLATLPRRTPLTLLGMDRTGTWARLTTRAGRVGLGRALPDAAGLAPRGQARRAARAAEGRQERALSPPRRVVPTGALDGEARARICCR